MREVYESQGCGCRCALKFCAFVCLASSCGVLLAIGKSDKRQNRNRNSQYKEKENVTVSVHDLCIIPRCD